MMKKSCMHAAIRELGTLVSEGALGLLSDGQLLDRFVERRDASAFEAIVERYGPLVWGVCRRVLRNHHDTEDAFQAAFLVLARKAASVMPREKLRNWLYGVAFQTAMNAKKARAKRRIREHPAWDMTEPEAEAVAHEHAEELLSRLDREVGRLPEKYRAPIILCELEGKTHRQAAEQLGWPVGTVSGRLSRAKAVLASRLSRPGTPLSVGALGVLLDHDGAQAGVPSDLVRSTAQAASLPAVGKAVATGVVSAQVAALTGEVLKTMLINKLTLSAGMLIFALALAAGGMSLTYRAYATEPANPKRGIENRLERSKAADAADEGTPPTAAQLNFTEATIENKPSAPNRLPGMETMSTSSLAEIPQVALEPPQYHWGYSFTASATGNMALAYNPETGEVKAVRLSATQADPIKVTTKVVKGICLVGLQLEGRKITRVAVFNPEPGKWSPLDLDEPASGVVQPRAFGRNGLGYQVGRFLYVYSSKTSTWDRLEIQAITKGQPIKVTLTELKGTGVVALRLEGQNITRVAAFNVESGKWSTLDLDEPASGVVEPMAFGRGALAYQVGRFMYLYPSKASTWDRLDLQPITNGQPIRVTPAELKGTGILAMCLEGPRIPRVAVFDLKSRTWSTLDLDEPASGVVQPMALGPGAAAYEVGQFLYVYHAETSKWDRLDARAIAEDKPAAPATKGQ
jgi:RNA polymerase sigma-70 factor (ECF subfamily)